MGWLGMMDQIKRELSVMKMVKHPNIVCLHEVMANKSKIYFAMELVHGGGLLEPLPNGSLILDRDPHVRVLVSHLVGEVGDLDKPIGLKQGLAVGVLGLAFPGQCKANLVAGDDLPLAHVDAGLAFDLVDLLGLDVEAPLAVEDNEIPEELGQEISGPFDAVCLGPVPVVDVGAVRPVLHDPSLVALAVFGHCPWWWRHPLWPRWGWPATFFFKYLIILFFYLILKLI
jgi:hypothetical protein